MPRRLPEKTIHTRRRTGRFEKREQKYDFIPFQGAPMKAGQEIDVIIDDKGSRGDGTTQRIASVERKFAIAEKIK